ncbi:MAG: tetrahydrofolate dehydrogenase/cyclohydrolase catalytic domain-containing protein [Kiritimatiellales bacterium]
MAARILDGKAISQEIRDELKVKVSALRKKGIIPGLGVLLVGDDPASRSYVTAKERACQETGIFSREIHLPETATQQEILDVVKMFNDTPEINGILVQLPLPDSKMERSVIEAIRPDKDVDGFHPVNVGLAALGLPAYIPCTPRGVQEILKRSGIKTDGARVAIVGRSNIVGRPLMGLLSSKSEMGNATVTLCHTHTKNIGEVTKQADIIIAAAGRPDTITADMVKEGAVVIDVGVNRIKDATKKSGFRLVGDVDFSAVSQKAAAITPVPGGVGPMTITMLLSNTVDAAELHHNAGMK